MSDYYKVLGVLKTARVEEIKKAYLKMVRENHPDRFIDPEMRAKADVRFQEITEAYNQLRNESSRKEYDELLVHEQKPPEEEANLYYKNGKVKEQLKEYERAIKFYYEAMRLQPNNIEYALSAGRALSLDKSKHRQAADLYAKILEKDISCRDAHLRLGELFFRKGMLTRAQRIYETALTVFPKDQELLKLMAEVQHEVGKARSRK